MRRIVASGVIAVYLLGLSGCGGDSDIGVPEDKTPAKSITISPADTLKNKKEGDAPKAK